MLKRLKSAIAFFVFKQLDQVPWRGGNIYARCTICNDYVVIFLSVLFETSLAYSVARYHQFLMILSPNNNQIELRYLKNYLTVS